MFILIENDNLNTPTVNLTPIFLKERDHSQLSSIKSLKFPHLEVVSQKRDKFLLTDLVSFTQPMNKSPQSEIEYIPQIYQWYKYKLQQMQLVSVDIQGVLYQYPRQLQQFFSNQDNLSFYQSIFNQVQNSFSSINIDKFRKLLFQIIIDLVYKETEEE